MDGEEGGRRKEAVKNLVSSASIRGGGRGIGRGGHSEGRGSGGGGGS